VHHTCPVRGGQSQQRALEYHQRRFGAGGALPPQQRAQGDAVDQLHHDGGAVRCFDVFVQPYHIR
jgi:hypothetical protein